MGESVKSQIIKRLLNKFPNAATKTLARIAYKENPLLWRDVESVRAAMRMYRGNCGAKNRNRVNGKYFRANKESGNPFGKLPEGITYFDKWQAYEIHGPATALILPDLHIRYHNNDAIRLALNMGKDRNVSHVLLNGDQIDFFSISHWETDPLKRDLPSELSDTRKFMEALYGIFPKAQFLWRNGNHEDRWERYLWLKSPELVGIDDFRLESILRFRPNTTVIRDKRPILFGKLPIIHGHEFGRTAFEPVNPARGFYLRAKELCLGSHYHRPSIHSEKDINGKVIRCWSTGCLCDLHPGYRPINSWSLGFAVVEIDKDDAFSVDNYSIVDGKIY